MCVVLSRPPSARQVVVGDSVSNFPIESVLDSHVIPCKYNMSSASVLHRFKMMIACWKKLPWAVLALAEAIVRPSPAARQRVVETAGRLADKFDANSTIERYGNVARRFFDPDHPG